MSHNQNNELLVTLGIVAISDLSEQMQAIQKVAQDVSQAFKFNEVIIISSAPSETCRKLFAELSQLYSQIRIIRVDQAIDFDSAASIIQAESIGDYVILSSGDELNHLPIDEVCNSIETGFSLLRIRRKVASLPGKVAARLINRVTGFTTDPRNIRAIVASRALLSDITEDMVYSKFLRFRTAGMEPEHTTLEIDAPLTRTGWCATFDRVHTLMQLLSFAAPRLLNILSVFSATLAFTALLWLFYVMMVFIFKDQVAEGWLSLSLLIGITLFLQTTVSSIICLGVARLLSKDRNSSSIRFFEDISKSDLFRNKDILNVERSRKEVS